MLKHFSIKIVIMATILNIKMLFKIKCQLKAN